MFRIKSEHEDLPYGGLQQVAFCHQWHIMSQHLSDECQKMRMTAMWCNQQRPLGAATGWRIQLGFHHGFPGSPPLSSAPPHQDPFQGRQAVGRGDNRGRVTLLCWLVIRRRQKIEGTRGGVSPASRTSCSWCWRPWVIEKNHLFHLFLSLSLLLSFYLTKQ